MTIVLVMSSRTVLRAGRRTRAAGRGTGRAGRSARRRRGRPGRSCGPPWSRSAVAATLVGARHLRRAFGRGGRRSAGAGPLRIFSCTSGSSASSGPIRLTTSDVTTMPMTHGGKRDREDLGQPEVVRGDVRQRQHRRHRRRNRRSRQRDARLHDAHASSAAKVGCRCGTTRRRSPASADRGCCWSRPRPRTGTPSAARRG